MRMNQKQRFGYNSRSDATTNEEGGLAFKFHNPKLELYSRVATMLMGEPKFYDPDSKGTEDGIIRLVKHIAKADPEFVLKLAYYCRNTLHLRSVPIFLLSLMAFRDAYPQGDEEQALSPQAVAGVRKYVPHIIQRADELAEVLALAQKHLGNIGDQSDKDSLPAQLKRGLSDAMNKFDAYQFAKYDRVNAAVKLKDVLKIVHPVPQDEEHSKLFVKIKDDKLEAPFTWETITMTEGSSTASWEKAAKVMPIFAIVRNLRNLLDHNVSTDILVHVMHKLRDPKVITNSKLFPFRFLSAYRELENHSNRDTVNLMNALEDAIELSCANISKIPGYTAVFCDTSGSMDSTLSNKGTVTMADVSTLMTAMASKICENAVTMAFHSRVYPINLPSRGGMIEQARDIYRRYGAGEATYGHLCVDYLLENNIKVDRMILLSDQQCYSYNSSDSFVKSLQKYRSTINPHVKVYSIDMAGYGTMVVPDTDRQTCLIAGWSEKIFNYIPIFEKDGTNAVDEIEKIQVQQQLRPLTKKQKVKVAKNIRKVITRIKSKKSSLKQKKAIKKRTANHNKRRR